MNNDSENTATVSKPTHEQISARAQAIWNAEGRPEGRDEAIWLQAEKQLYDEAKESIPGSSESPIAPPAGGPQSSGAKPTQSTPQKAEAASSQSEQMTSRAPASGAAKSGNSKRRSSGR